MRWRSSASTCSACRRAARVAIEYTARHPERVRRLLLYGAFARGWAKRGEEGEHAATLALIKRGWGGDSPAYRQLFTSQGWRPTAESGRAV